MGKTVIGLYDDVVDAQRTVQTLLDNGFNADDLSLIVNHAAAQSNAGTIAGHWASLSLLTIPGIGRVLTSGPLFCTQNLAEEVSQTALLDVLLAVGVPWERAQMYAEGVRRGGSLVLVRPPDLLAVRAVHLIHRCGPVDLDQRARQWRQNGWRHFDVHATPYSRVDIEREYAQREAQGVRESSL